MCVSLSEGEFSISRVFDLADGNNGAGGRKLAARVGPIAFVRSVCERCVLEGVAEERVCGRRVPRKEGKGESVSVANFC